MNEMEEVIKEFLVESQENVAELDSDLVALESAPSDKEILSRIFRTFHTIKGSCAFLGYQKLQSVAHAGETLLGRLRDGSLSLDAEITSVLLAAVDAIRAMLAAVEAGGNDGDGDFGELVQKLTSLGDQAAGDRGSAQPESPSRADMTTGVAKARAIAAAVDGEPDANQGTAVMLAEELKPSPATNPVPQSSVPRARDSQVIQPAGGPATLAAQPTYNQEAPATSSVLDTTIRLDVTLLDKLMMLVSELVLARNQIVQHGAQLNSSARDGAGFLGACRQLNLITSELQEQVMKTRMQPISNVWSRFPRLVRDIALACGKQVHLEIDGSETELDKTVIEAIRDPLTHLVRNAVDHGIERPDVRRAARKPAEGRLVLRAYHEGGQVNIEVSDDGAGMDAQHIKRRAIDRGVVSPDHAAQMSDQSLLGLVFVPGFSTAAAVTAVSGRGVGMDVVKTNIESVGGTVDILSQPGCGTTVKMRIPLTLAIIKALIVTTAGDRYAIPQVSIVELVRLAGERAHSAIERFQGVPVFRFREKLLPVVHLPRLLDVEVAARHDAEDEVINIAVLQAGDRLFGLVVDRVSDTQEIVVKPLWRKLKGIECFAGATIMGDGQVALILDVFGLAQQASVVPKTQGRTTSEVSGPGSVVEDRRSLVLVEAGDGGRMAIPLDRVARLEKFSRSAVERTGRRDVVQYRGEILPLIDVAVALDDGRDATSRRDVAAGRPETDTVPVVVCAREGRSVGLVVQRIIDIAEQVLEVKGPATRDNVLYSAVVQGRVTEFLDVEALIHAADPEFAAVPVAIVAEE